MTATNSTRSARGIRDSPGLNGGPSSGSGEILRTVPANTASTWNAFWHGGPLAAHEQAQASRANATSSATTAVEYISARTTRMVYGTIQPDPEPLNTVHVNEWRRPPIMWRSAAASSAHSHDSSP